MRSIRLKPMLCFIDSYTLPIAYFPRLLENSEN